MAATRSSRRATRRTARPRKVARRRPAKQLGKQVARPAGKPVEKAAGKPGSKFMPAPQVGSPMTYMLNGRQYIVIGIGGGDYSSEHIAYRLPK